MYRCENLAMRGAQHCQYESSGQSLQHCSGSGAMLGTMLSMKSQQHLLDQMIRAIVRIKNIF